MAHQTNVHQFSRTVPNKSKDKYVKDPNCKKLIKHSEVKHFLFSPKGTLNFCSKECEEEYVEKQKTSFKSPT